VLTKSVNKECILPSCQVLGVVAMLFFASSVWPYNSSIELSETFVWLPNFVLPPFEIVSHFSFSRFIVFAIYLDIHYILIHTKDCI
jgi:hypothetical protein